MATKQVAASEETVEAIKAIKEATGVSTSDVVDLAVDVLKYQLSTGQFQIQRGRPALVQRPVEAAPATPAEQYAATSETVAAQLAAARAESPGEAG